MSHRSVFILALVNEVCALKGKSRAARLDLGAIVFSRNPCSSADSIAFRMSSGFEFLVEFRIYWPAFDNTYAFEFSKLFERKESA